MTLRHIHAVLCVAAAALLAGCESAQPPATIELAPEWRLAETPRVSIGVMDGDERYMFRNIRSAVILSDGSIVVADTDPSLTLYDSTGVFVKRIGGRGTGPGEFAFLTRAPFSYRGDSMALWDMGQRRISTFDATGTFGRTANVLIPSSRRPPGTTWSQSCCFVRYAFGDGSFLLEFPALIPNTPGPPRYAEMTLARVSADGSRSDTIGSFRDGLYRYNANAPSRITEFRLSIGFMYTMVGDTIIGGNGEEQSLLRIVPGSRPDTIRLGGAPVQVTDALKASYAQAWRDEFARDPKHFEGPPDDLFEGEYVTHVPAYTRVASDPSGNLWLGQWKLPYSDGPWTFHVYTARGQPVARIGLPASAWNAYIGTDRVAVIESDSLDVQRVRVYDIVRPSAR